MTARIETPDWAQPAPTAWPGVRTVVLWAAFVAGYCLFDRLDMLRFPVTSILPLSDLAAKYAETAPRGEVCLLLGPAPQDADDALDLDATLRAALAGASLKQAVADVTAATGLPRKQVYARALALAAEAP